MHKQRDRPTIQLQKKDKGEKHSFQLYLNSINNNDDNDENNNNKQEKLPVNIPFNLTLSPNKSVT